MDDATRAELAELRRRAFGPTPDIADDPAAMDRLALLEDRSQDEHAVAADGGATPLGLFEEEGTDAEPFALATHPPLVADVAGVGAVGGDGAAVAGTSRPWRRRSGAGIALGAAVIATVVVVSTAVARPPESGVQLTTQELRAAYAVAVDPDARVLVQVPLHGWYGSENVPPLPSDAPPFPTSGTIQWATNLGSYYGWHLWIGGGKGLIQDEVCIAVSRGDTGKGRCVAEPLRSSSALAVTLPMRSVPEGDRPAALVPGKNLGFWWFHDSAVTIMLTTGPEQQ